jgi:hypothetical protein
MADDRTPDELIAEADQYVMYSDNQARLICRLADKLRAAHAERDAAISALGAAISALGRSLRGDWPIERGDGGPSYWRYDDAEVTPGEADAITQADKDALPDIVGWPPPARSTDD